MTLSFLAKGIDLKLHLSNGIFVELFVVGQFFKQFFIFIGQSRRFLFVTIFKFDLHFAYLLFMRRLLFLKLFLESFLFHFCKQLDLFEFCLGLSVRVLQLTHGLLFVLLVLFLQLFVGFVKTFLFFLEVILLFLFASLETSL